MRILLIDDEPVYYKMMVKGLEKAGHQLDYAKTGNEGLAAIPAKTPDIVIVDLKLPDIPGLDIIKRIRSDRDFAYIPILVITGKDELSDKLKAFELGADDYMVKPFELDELIARLGILARRGEAIKYVRQKEADQEKTSTMITVHSLRGGVGCSSIAVNLALAFHTLWGKRTLVVDSVITAGQVAMMLNASPRANLGNYADMPSTAMDATVAEDLANLHKSGIHYVAAPKLPVAEDAYSNDFWSKLLEHLLRQNEFVVVDAPHDFSDIAIQMLNSASYVLVVMAPELASLRAAVNALDVYERLDFEESKIKIVLNQTTNRGGIKQSQVEKALGFPVSYIPPYEADEVIRAINFGEPFILSNPELPISAKLEDIAYELSDEVYRNIPPALPSATWKRVMDRIAAKK
jgi:pilus assembly protein CpaE